MSDFDVIFVGGGLASTLSALALTERQPDVRIAIVERGGRLGGNHTWCFHAADLPLGARPLVAPLVVQRWDGYSVHFPGRTRRIGSTYACITSDRLHEVATARLAGRPRCQLLLGKLATRVTAAEVELDDGRTLRADLVIDATGPAADDGQREQRPCGFQKFVGLELRVEPHHTWTEPVLFDARMAQRDGFRFMYVLPLSPDRLLVEETFFSDHPGLDEVSSTRAIMDYVAQRGLSACELLRSERGVLPMPWHDPGFAIARRPLQAGYRGGMFHPVTGYSFPLAVRFALALAASDLKRLSSSPLAAFAKAHASQLPFLLLLTRMLFTCFAPEQRFRVLEHFYRLPEQTIERFYAAELTGLDRLRIFLGAPPKGFSVGRALQLQTGAAP